MKDVIYREDAIQMLDVYIKPFVGLIGDIGSGINGAREIIKLLPSVDRLQGEVNAVKIYEQASHDLEFGHITLGEFEERIEPLKHLYYDRPRGEWIYWREDGIKRCKCTICLTSYGCLDTPYCPNCGALMKGTDDERHDI